MHYLFKLDHFNDQHVAEYRLLALGFESIYLLEDENSILLGAYHEERLNIDFLEVVKIEETPEIDWEEEWVKHAQHYENGEFNYQLINGKQLLMQPGGGFGDLSHPTTQLMIESLEASLPLGEVIDIGSGSGILSIAAALLGAEKVWGIEIDEVALEHSRKNSALNQTSDIQFVKTLPLQCLTLKNPLILMNMTLIDQKELWESTPSIASLKGKWIISGILKSQLSELEKRIGQKAKSTKQKEDWCLCEFHK